MESYLVIGLNLLAVLVAVLAISVRGWNRLNAYMLGLISSAALWTSILELQKFDDQLALFAVRSAFAFSILMAFFVWKFVDYYLNGANGKPTAMLGVVTVLGCVLSFTNLITESVEKHPTIEGSVIPDRGILYLPFILILLSMMVTSLTKLYRAGNTSTGRRKAQLRTIFIGLTVGFIIGVITNVVLPNITGNTQYGRFGFIAVSIWTFSLIYAIVQHKFLDIKKVFARSVSYIVSIALFTAIYFFIYYLIVNYSHIEDYDFIYNFLFTILVGVSYRPLLSRFNSISDKYFYRDAYEPQEMIDELNNALVTTSDLESLLSQASKIIQSNLKSSFVTFYIRETSYFDSRVIGKDGYDKTSSTSALEEILDLTPKIRKKVHSSEVDSATEDERRLSSLLKKNDIELVGRLVSTLDFEVKGIGVFVVGAKRSGAIYTTQDMRVLEIIANELVIAVENVLRTEEIEQFNVTLQNKIDSATKELKDSNEKLLALDEAKDEFVSMASHQLRTPLTSIKGYLSMVLEGDAGEITDTQKEMLGQAFFSSQRMVYLIADLLNVSRLKTGKFNIEQSPVNLAKVVEEEVSQLQEGAKAKNITLSYKTPKNFPELMLDDMKTRQVIMNFTDNAIYYTPDGGTIKLQVHNREKAVEFTVTDSGIGVPKEQQHKLFTKFFRADNARKARPDGTGLGLFMAKKVIVSQGGSIIFKSKEGKGSTFGFSFPKANLEVKNKSETVN